MCNNTITKDPTTPQIQVRAVWGPHVRLDERDVLTPQVRRCVPGSVTARCPAADIRARCTTPAGCDRYIRQ